MIFDGFSNFVLASAIEPLRVARDVSVESAVEQSFAWRLLSMDGADVRSSSGLHLRCDGALTDMGEADILFIVAGYDVRERSGSQTLVQLQQASRQVPVLAGLDCGAWLMAAAGLLNGHRATLHWQNMAHFAETWLDVEVSPERYVIDRGRISAGEAQAVLDLMLYLITRRAGPAVAFEVHNMFSREGSMAAGEGQKSTISAYVPGDSHLLRVVRLMRQHVECPLRLETVATRSAMTVRTMSRLFRRKFSTSPGRFYETLRLETARTLARETDLPASEIATRTGYASSACLSRAFHRHFGQTLRGFRTVLK